MMKKRKIGAVTVGQSPRTDITTDADTFFHGQVEILESGALDSYSLEEVQSLSRPEGDYLLTSRMRRRSPCGQKPYSSESPEMHFASGVPWSRTDPYVLYWRIGKFLFLDSASGTWCSSKTDRSLSLFLTTHYHPHSISGPS